MSRGRTARDRSSAALRDPVRSSGGLHEAGRFRRGIAEFLRIPLLITLVACVAGLLVSVLDAESGGGLLRRLASDVVPGGGASNVVSAIATSLMTVTSITFSVLLIAVQQTASSLSAVVFDQYLRRRANQAYFGFFVGATAFTFIVFGLGRNDPAPVYGAVCSLVVTIAALVALLMLIHSTVDQMRPHSVVRSIHELALRARERELRLLGRTRAERRSPEQLDAREVSALDSGYVVTIDMDGLAAAARRAGAVEVLVDRRLGDYVVFGETISRLVGVAPDDDRFDDDVLTAFGFDDMRDVDVESGYAIDQLENIAWVTGASASQSPYTAASAVRALRDLVGRWLIAGERDRSDRADQAEELPVVYEDGAVERILRALGTLLVAASESRQAQTAAVLLSAFAHVAPRLRSEQDRRVFARALDRSLPSVIQQAELPALEDALLELEGAMLETGFDVARVRQTRHLLRVATERMLPKPSDEPEAAHPRES